SSGLDARVGPRGPDPRHSQLVEHACGKRSARNHNRLAAESRDFQCSGSADTDEPARGGDIVGIVGRDYRRMNGRFIKTAQAIAKCVHGGSHYTYPPVANESSNRLAPAGIPSAAGSLAGSSPSPRCSYQYARQISIAFLADSGTRSTVSYPAVKSILT